MIFPDPSKQDRAELREMIRQAGSRLNVMDDVIASVKLRLDGHSAKISLLENKGSAQELNDLNAKLEALELWKAQIMTLLTENGTTGRPKLTPTGRRVKAFYGRS